MALVLAPLLWTSGLALQWLARQFSALTPAELEELDAATFAAPMLLVVHERQPTLSTAGWTLLAIGIILLVPAMLSIGHLAAVAGAPRVATIGTILLTIGLTARMFYLGIDATAFNLVERLGATAATPLVLDGYGDLAYTFWRVPVIASAGTILGSIILAVAAYLSRIWGLIRCLLMLPAGWLGMGVLKEHEPGFGGVALILALLPTGILLLRGRTPRRRRLLRSTPSERHPVRDVLSW